MSYFTLEELGILDQAITILDKKLKTQDVFFDDANEIKKYLRLQLENCQREHLGCFYLNCQLKLIEYRVVFSGAVNQCTISAREFVKDALELNATAIILAHNHPSGDATPSNEDVRATKRMREAFELFDIRLVDHFVVGKNQINSLTQMNLI